METADKETLVSEVLGYCGAMLSGSKTGYAATHPTHLVFYNANVFDSQANKLWFGDLDLTGQIEQLQKLSAAMGEPIFVTRETPFRFESPTVAELTGLADAEKSGVVRIEAINSPTQDDQQRRQ